VHTDERARRSRRAVVNGGSHELFTRAGFASEQHRGPTRRNLSYLVKYGIHLDGLADDIVEAREILNLTFERGRLLTEPRAFEHPLHHNLEFGQVQGFRQVVGRTLPHGCDGGLSAVRGRHEDHRQICQATLELA